LIAITRFSVEGKKSIFGKVWHFIWEENSVWSWIVNILLAFLLIKFLIYPGIGLAMGTSHPIVAVISNSMEHDGNFEQWWNSPACNFQCTQAELYEHYNITEQQFLHFNFRNGFNKGDIIFLRGMPAEKIEKGTVIVFNAGDAEPIIHRVVDKWSIAEANGNAEYHFITKGDYNQVSLLKEADVSEKQILGIALFRIPYAGYIKIWFVDYVVKPIFTLLAHKQ